MKLITTTLLSVIAASFVLLPSANASKAVSAVSIESTEVIEHKGRTRPDGCHVNRKTRVRHCH